MADIELVIKIDKERFRDIQRIASVQLERNFATAEQIIANGTPLPDGHGRLIDADKLNIRDISPAYGFVVMGVTDEDINDAPTIIEADKAEGEGV